VHEGTSDAIRIGGVIDGPSLAAHIDILTIPGADTVMDVSITILPRRDIADIGIAPLTSMYLKGPMHAAVSDDFRPRVHDSNLLFIENGAGEALWRPIGNPSRVETSAFADTNPRQFGLHQTTRTYEDFEDSEARYEDRPSATVTPKTDWGAGAVMLVEIPTGTEFLDNIVAFWRPKDPLLAGGAYRYQYDIRWTRSAPDTRTPRSILQSRSGREHDRPGSRRYVIDFAGQPDDLIVDLSVYGAPADAVFGTSLYALPEGRGTRVTFLLTPGEAQSLELRLVLRSPGGAAASPVWLHRWTQKRDGGV
jgi:glucans biosynthesis protein